VTAESLVEAGDSGLYAYWRTHAYAVRFHANGGEGEMPDQPFMYGRADSLVSNAFTNAGFGFSGWAAIAGGEVAFGDGAEVHNLTAADGGIVNLFAVWAKVATMPVLWPDKTEGESFVPPPATEASVYDGFLYDAEGNLKGTVQVKVAKPKNGTAKVTATFLPLGGKKQSLKGTLDVVTGKVSGMDLTLGQDGMSGTFGGYEIDGARSPFSSKDKVEQNAANALASGWAAVNVAWDGGTLAVSIGKKGKVKVAGGLASGTKVSVTGQLIVGEEWLCVPVSWAKKNESVTFSLWLPKTVAVNGGQSKVVGLGGEVNAGVPKALKGGAAFRIDAVALCGLLGSNAYASYLPDGISVAQSGSRWTVAGGAKAGKVQLGKDGKVNEAKAGANPSGLKLTYKAKDGTFKGSFKVYADVNGKLKSATVNVTGVMVGNEGYGMASIKKVGSLPISIR